jgi:hypothetical protein
MKKPNGRAKKALSMARKPHFSGYIHGDTGGRTDNKSIDVGAGSHVIPADVVSSLGEGNSIAGAKALHLTLGMGPYGTDAPGKFADGGEVEGVPIVAASGEIVVPPEKVLEIGNGDQEAGHAILDQFIKHQRDKTIKTLKRLPGPKKD